ncbi:hypothetical protein BH10ACT1_BH10ACT1_34500 [soil metagenome]
MSAALMMANRLRGKGPKSDPGARPFTAGLAARLATWPARPR